MDKIKKEYKTLIDIKDLNVFYGKKRVVDNMNLSFKKIVSMLLLALQVVEKAPFFVVLIE